MRRLRHVLLFSLLIAGVGVPALAGHLAPSGASAQGETVVAYKGARLYTCAGPVIDRGTLIISKGKIVAAGAEKDVAVPPGAVVHDVTGKTIIPGLVDTHSHIGIFGRPAVGTSADGNEMTGPVQPGLRAIDAINPDDPGIQMALAGGVTTANIMPGSAAMPSAAKRCTSKLRGTDRRGHAHPPRPRPGRHQVRQRREPHRRLRQKRGRLPARA